MPELPEVETIRVALAPRLVGRRIVAVRITDPRVTRPYPPEAVEDRLTGERIVDVARRGKYVVFELESGAHLLVHLRMTGSFRIGRDGVATADPYVRCVVTIDDGSDVVYRDVRRFGTWLVLERDEFVPYLASRLGEEPLGREFTRARLGEKLARRRAPVKAVLLDQKTVAGIGNIYADEALWLARIHPARVAGGLSRGEVVTLHRAVRKALRTGLERQGATLRDYRDPDGGAGSMQDEFRVYGRAGQPCRRCGTPIEKARIAGRGTWFCPRCQPLSPE